MSCQNLTKVTGEHLLFLGTSTASWSIQQFQDAARFARAHNIDNLLLKTADGGNWWYGGINGYRQRRDVINSEGVGVIPYTYSYGNKYGVLDAEINILLALLAEPENVAIADMETEWNGQTVWGSHLASRIQGKGTFLVSTWADPNLQNWQGVIQALNPCVSAYMAQQYNNYLASCWSQFAAASAACLQPTVNMTQDFGANDPVSIASAAYNQGHTAISIWHYETAAANPSLLDAIYAAFPKGGKTMPTIPQGWTDDGTTLRAPDGTPVVLGFRDHVLSSNWDPANVPLEAEQHLAILEQSNPSLGAGQSQIFRWKRLEYTPKMGVFEGWLGQELIWYQKQAAQLQLQIADLQGQITMLQQSVLAQELQKEQNKLMQIGQIINS